MHLMNSIPLTSKKAQLTRGVSSPEPKCCHAERWCAMSEDAHGPASPQPGGGMMASDQICCARGATSRILGREPRDMHTDASALRIDPLHPFWMRYSFFMDAILQTAS